MSSYIELETIYRLIHILDEYKERLEFEEEDKEFLSNKILKILSKNRDTLLLVEKDKENISLVFNSEVVKFEKYYKNVREAGWLDKNNIELRIKDSIYFSSIFSIKIYESGNTWRNEEWLSTCYTIEVEGILNEGYTIEDFEKFMDKYMNK